MKKSISLLLLIVALNSCSSVAPTNDNKVDDDIIQNDTIVEKEDTNITTLVESEDLVPTPKGLTEIPPTPPAISLRGIRGENQDSQFKKD